VDPATTLTALAEPTRLRIVELLRERPHTVGEIAERLGARQPQVTKHLQTLSRAGVVAVHPLGQRRVCALEPGPLRELRDWLERLVAEGAEDDALAAYRRALEAETAAAAADPAWAQGRALRFARTLPAPPETVWAHWTTAELMRAWWAPDHFTVAEAAMQPRAGGEVRLVMQEGDGARHAAAGHVIAADAPRALDFEMAPLGPDGTPLFSASHAVRLRPHRGGTDLTLDIRIDRSTEAAAPAIAGMRIGWEQSLRKLAAAVTP
jgi:uncharacterized protein YndB with AHSA1/START domain/DNA-binding transcriptional ArsR family regulator